MIKLKFRVETRPHSFDLEDELESVLNDTGIQMELETYIEDVLERYLNRRGVQVIVDLEW